MSQSKKSHKIFSLIMLALIVGGTVAGFTAAAVNMWEYNSQKKQQEQLYDAVSETQSETEDNAN